MGKTDVNSKDKIFLDSIGQKATVQRETVAMEQAATPNRMLCDLGLKIQQEPKFQLTNYRYLGSAAVHIYFNDTLGQLDFVSQANPLVLYRCPESLAAKAIDDLIREMKAAYGKRSGRTPSMRAWQ
jgi:hypothetical protein